MKLDFDERVNDPHAVEWMVARHRLSTPHSPQGPLTTL